MRARDKPEDPPINITIQETPSNRHSTLQQFTLMCDMPATQVNPNGGTMVFYPDDSGLNLLGHLFHTQLTTANFQNPPNPLKLITTRKRANIAYSGTAMQVANRGTTSF